MRSFTVIVDFESRGVSVDRLLNDFTSEAMNISSISGVVLDIPSVIVKRTVIDSLGYIVEIVAGRYFKSIANNPHLGLLNLAQKVEIVNNLSAIFHAFSTVFEDDDEAVEVASATRNSATAELLGITSSAFSAAHIFCSAIGFSNAPTKYLANVLHSM